MTASSTQALPTIEAIHAFLKSCYKFERFEGRNDERDGFADYSMRVARSTQVELERRGWSLVSRHESGTGRAVWFNDQLEITESPYHTANR